MFKSLLEPYRGDGSDSDRKYKGGVMLAAIAAVLLVLWLLGFIAFHVTFGAIHLLLVIAVVLFVAHFLTGRSAAV
jgi:hypothetical protein